MVILAADVRAVRHFQAWCEQSGQAAQVCADCLSALLEGRAAYLDRPDPTRWRRGDVRALLYDLAVPRLSEQCDLIAHTVATLDAFLVFLDRTGRMHPGSTAARHLRQELAQHAGGFPAAMADRSRCRMAKTLYQAMIADGVAIHDYDAVDAWVGRFNQAPTGERAAVLEHLLADQPALLTAQFVARAGKVAALAPGQEPIDSRDLLPHTERVPDVMPVFAPVTVPTETEAAMAARQSPLLGRLLALALWFGPGRKVTKDGEPVPADVRALAERLGLGLPGTKISHPHEAPGLRELFWLARQLDLVDLRRDGLVPGPRLTPWRDGDESNVPDDDLLDLWRDVLTLIETGKEIPDEAPRIGGALMGQMSGRTRECIPAIVLSLYQAAALDQDQELAPLLIDHVDELLQGGSQLMDVDAGELVEAALRVALCASLDRLVSHGALEVFGPAGADLVSSGGKVEFLTRVVLMASSAEVVVRLTPLGRWAVNQELRAEGAHAPSTEAGTTHREHVMELASKQLDRIAQMAE